LVDVEPSSPRGGVLKWNMLVTCVACRVAVLGYMEDLWRTYVFADFLYLDQLIPYPSSHTLLLLTKRYELRGWGVKGALGIDNDMYEAIVVSRTELIIYAS
jgi:hypothetical protein